MHLADALSQSDLQCIIHGYTFFYQYVCSLGIEPHNLCAAHAMLYHWATGTWSLEPLAQAIRKSEVSIKIHDHNHSISLYADDIILYLDHFDFQSLV